MYPPELLLMSPQNSSSYFLGDANNDSLQRIYGISFPDKKQLTEYKAFLAEAARRDHRRIGKVIISIVAWNLSDGEQDQELFFFNEMSPGSCFFLPHGTRIYNTLLEFIRVIESFLLWFADSPGCSPNTSNADTKKVGRSVYYAPRHAEFLSYLSQHVPQQALGAIGPLAKL